MDSETTYASTTRSPIRYAKTATGSPRSVVAQALSSRAPLDFDASQAKEMLARSARIAADLKCPALAWFADVMSERPYSPSIFANAQRGHGISVLLHLVDTFEGPLKGRRLGTQRAPRVRAALERAA